MIDGRIETEVEQTNPPKPVGFVVLVGEKPVATLSYEAVKLVLEQFEGIKQGWKKKAMTPALTDAKLAADLRGYDGARFPEVRIAAADRIASLSAQVATLSKALAEIAGVFEPTGANGDRGDEVIHIARAALNAAPAPDEQP